MSIRKTTRRDALGTIAKTGLTLGAGTCFFLSLKTSPLASVPWDLIPKEQPGQKLRPSNRAESIPEKVVISGSGATIIFQISGPAGRHCGVAYAKVDEKGEYKAVKKSRSVIGKDGLCTIEVDVKNLPVRKVYLRLVTSSKRDFSADVKGTKAFEVYLSKGIIRRFGGTNGKALEDTLSAVTLGVGGYQIKKKR